VEFLKTIQPDSLKDLHRFVALQPHFVGNGKDQAAIPVDQRVPGLLVSIQARPDQFRVASIFHIGIFSQLRYANQAGDYANATGGTCR
jgi:hypothetical protein